MANTTKKQSLQVEMEEITKLIELLKTSGINEIEITQGETGIRLRKDPEPQISQATVANVPQQMAPQQITQPVAETAQVPEKIDGKLMKSPMVGTYYEAPAPDASPYVQIGDKVKKGQTICIIEAMKTMNQIEAEEEGILKEVLVNNAQPVEFGEPLFVIQ